jgi:hypothetical protein
MSRTVVSSNVKLDSMARLKFSVDTSMENVASRVDISPFDSLWALQQIDATLNQPEMRIVETKSPNKTTENGYIAKLYH